MSYEFACKLPNYALRLARVCMCVNHLLKPTFGNLHSHRAGLLWNPRRKKERRSSDVVLSEGRSGLNPGLRGFFNHNVCDVGNLIGQPGHLALRTSLAYSLFKSPPKLWKRMGKLRFSLMSTTSYTKRRQQKFVCIPNKTLTALVTWAFIFQQTFHGGKSRKNCTLTYSLNPRIDIKEVLVD